MGYETGSWRLEAGKVFVANSLVLTLDSWLLVLISPVSHLTSQVSRLKKLPPPVHPYIKILTFAATGSGSGFSPGRIKRESCEEQELSPQL